MRRFLLTLSILALTAPLAACNGSCGGQPPTISLRWPLALDNEPVTVAAPRYMAQPAYYAPAWQAIQAPNACQAPSACAPAYTAPQFTNPCQPGAPDSIPALRAK